MAGEWRSVALGDMVELKRGYDLPQRERSRGTIPIVSSSGVTGYHSEAKATGPGVVTGRYGTLGEVFYVAEDFWPLNTTLYVRDFKGNNPRFVSYFLQSVNFLSYSDKAAVPGINRNHLHQARVRYPNDLAEQCAIAHILGSLDDKIELNRRMNETLEEMARALFKSWFVDFDPVRAKMEGRQLPGIDDETAALFPDSFEDSTLGEIPKGWRITSIGDAVKVLGGGTPSTKESSFWDGGTHCWATPKDLSKLQSPVLLDTERKVTDAGLAKISSGLLPVGTVLLSSRAPIGYLAVAQVPVAVNQGFIAMLCDGPLTTHYVLHWTRISVEQIKGRAGGSTFPEISKKNFRTMLLLAPPDEVLSAFEKRVVPLYDKMSANLRQSSTLAAVRDALLPKLLSGETRVKEAV
ncbi:MAG: restriction endonuclease subunit S [Rubrobacteraceae bacterium]